MLNWAALAVLAVTAAAPARADLLLAFSDAEYAALNAAASPFVQLGGATIQWGNPSSTANWEWAIQGADDATLLKTGNVTWAKVTNTMLPYTNSTPLFGYTAAGRLSLAFKTGTANVINTYATVGTGANAFWIRGIMPPKGAASSVALAGLTLTFTADGSVWDLSSLTADVDGDYVGFYDPRLAQGFKIKYGFGYFNNYGGDANIWSPSFQFSVGTYTTPPANPYLSPVESLFDSGPPLDLLAGPAASRFAALGPSTPGAVPEPASWALMIGGFGLIGAALRRRRMAVV